MQNSSMILVPVNGPNVAPFGFSAYPVPPHCFGQRPESKRTGLVLTRLAQQIMQEPGTPNPRGSDPNPAIEAPNRAGLHYNKNDRLSK